MTAVTHADGRGEEGDGEGNLLRISRRAMLVSGGRASELVTISLSRVSPRKSIRSTSAFFFKRPLLYNPRRFGREREREREREEGGHAVSSLSCRIAIAYRDRGANSLAVWHRRAIASEIS